MIVHCCLCFIRGIFYVVCILSFSYCTVLILDKNSKWEKYSAWMESQRISNMPSVLQNDPIACLLKWSSLGASLCLLMYQSIHPVWHIPSIFLSVAFTISAPHLLYGSDHVIFHIHSSQAITSWFHNHNLLIWIKILTMHQIHWTMLSISGTAKSY